MPRYIHAKKRFSSKVFSRYHVSALTLMKHYSGIAAKCSNYCGLVEKKSPSPDPFDSSTRYRILLEKVHFSIHNSRVVIEVSRSKPNIIHHVQDHHFYYCKIVCSVKMADFILQNTCTVINYILKRDHQVYL